MRSTLPDQGKLILTLALFLAGNAAAQDSDLLAWTGFPGDEQLVIPEVLTPARLRQPKTETPLSVTIITRQMIEEHGARSIPEALRLVPGVTVGSALSNVTRLSYHGTNATEQRRLQVLIDGRSQYAPNLATVDWQNLPIALEDIERIEFTRGPNAAAYGVNAFLATINIITRHPFDTPGFLAHYTTSGDDFQRYTARLGGVNDQFSWRLTGYGFRDDGFDTREDGSEWRDGVDLDGANFALQTPDGKPDRFRFEAGLNAGHHQFRMRPNDGQITPPDRDDRDRFASLRWEHDFNENHFIHVQAYIQRRERRPTWRNCSPQVLFSQDLDNLAQQNPPYGAEIIDALISSNPAASIGRLVTAIQSGSANLGTAQEDLTALQIIDDVVNGDGGDIVCGDINENVSEKRLDLEVQDTLRISPDLRIVSGFSIREDSYHSTTFFGGAGQNSLLRLFANVEYRFTPEWLLNAGAMWERNKASGTTLSPRVALNYLIDPYQSLRFVLSSATRSPDTFEQFVEWSYLAENLDPLINGESEARTVTIRSPGGLKEERIISREVGYFMSLPEHALELDIKVFRDDLRDLIGAPLQYFSFEPDNNLDITHTGFEVETAWKPHPKHQLRLTYGYLDQDTEYTGTTETTLDLERVLGIESRLTANHTASASWVYRWSPRFRSTLAYYLADDLNDFDWERADLVLAYRPALEKLELDLSLKYEYLFGNAPLIFDEFNLDNKHQVYGSITMQF